MNKRIKLIELFGGIGSQAKALSNLGLPFDHHRLVEFDKYAVKSYNAVHRTDFTPVDIREVHAGHLGIDYDQMGRYDYLVTYSFPCQDLSIAGKKEGMDRNSGTRSSLLWEVNRIFSELSATQFPQYLLMENVTQVHGKKNIENFNAWLSFLEDRGYHNYYADLNATGFTIPQNRDRCFVVSTLGDKGFKFPEAVPLTRTAFNFYQPFFDPKYYLSEKMTRYILDLNDTQKGTKWEGRANNDVLNSEVVHTISVRGAGGNQRADVSNFLVVDDLRPNLKVSEIKKKIKVTGQLPRIRRLTPLECWRFMGFDDQDYFNAAVVNSDAQLYKQAGNSIVVPVLMAIFRNMFKEYFV